MHHKLTRSIHDYFFAKSLEKVRPGGVMALITSRYTMDKNNDTIRRHLAEHADLLGAIRLPNTAFKGNAGTEVTTDILFLRKRPPGMLPAGHAWQKLDTIDSGSGPIEVNEYYARHPHMMLGTMKLEGTMYRGAEPTCEGQLTPEVLAHAIKTLPAGAYIPKDEGRGPPPRRRFLTPKLSRALRTALTQCAMARSSCAMATASSPRPCLPPPPLASGA